MLPARPISHGRRKDAIPVNAIVIPAEQYMVIHDKLAMKRDLSPDARAHEIARQDHEASIGKVATWKNTVQDNRRKRLQATQVKAEQAEQARVQQDEEWHAVLDAEKKAFLAHAGQMQLYETPEVRALHSKLNTMRVIEERGLQLEHKHKRKEYEIAQAAAQQEHTVATIRAGELEEAVRKEQFHQRALDFAHAQHEQHVAKHSDASAHAREAVLLKDAQDRLLQDYQESEVHRLGENQKKNRAFVAGLDDAVDAHKLKHDSDQKAYAQLLTHNAEIRAKEDAKEKAIKSVLHSEVVNRQSRTEQVTHVTSQALMAEKAVKDSVMTNWSQAVPLHDYAAEQDKIAANFKQHRFDDMAIAAKQIQLHKDAKEELAMSTQLFVHKRDEKLRLVQAAEEAKTAKRYETAKEYAQDHLQRAAHKQVIANALQMEEQQRHRAEVAQLQSKDQQYFQYAAEVIGQEMQAGRNTNLLENLVQHQKTQGIVHYRGIGSKQIDTWPRLFGSEAVS